MAMTVAHVCDSFSSVSETFIYDFIMEEHRQGVDAQVLTFQRVNEDDRPYPHVTEMPAPSRWNVRRIVGELSARMGMDSADVWPQRRERIERVLRQIEPDIVHAHFGTIGGIVRPVAEALGLPLVVTFYGKDASKAPSHRTWQREYPRLWKSVDAVTVLSEEMRDTVEDLGCPSEKIDVIHLSRNLDTFSFRLPQPPVRTFLSVGRLTEKKGHRDGIRALKQVTRVHPNVRLQVVGDGPLCDDLDAAVRRQELKGSVELLGRQPNSAVADAMREADAFLLCSKTAPDGDREGTPTVLVEAQAVGLPCVSTRHAGIPEMIPAANHHLLAPEGDADAIADRMRAVIEASEDQLHAIARAGRERVEQKFDLTSEVRRLRRVYDRVCDRLYDQRGNETT